MPTVDEVASSALGGLNPILRDGIEAVSGTQTITFIKYVRTILPADGFVFWVKATLLGDTTAPLVVTGSLHTATEQVQLETESLGRVAVVFTSETDVLQGFNATAPGDLYIGSVAGDAGSPPIRFAFSRLGYYQNAGIFHYSGIAITPASESQIIDSQNDLDTTDIVASNSLPAWLSLNNYAPFYGFGNTIALYPSFLIPNNTQPPYGAVHVDPQSLQALSNAPYLDAMSSHYSLMEEKVRVTLYGVRHADVMSFVDCVLQFSEDYDVIGMMSNPVVRDERRPQNELGTIAQQKTIDFHISYDQSAIRNIARQMLSTAIPSLTERYPTYWPVDPTAPC